MVSELAIGMLCMVANGLMQTVSQVIANVIQSQQQPYYYMLSVAAFVSCCVLLTFIKVMDKGVPERRTWIWVVLRGTFGGANTVLNILAVLAGAPMGDVAALTSISGVIGAILGRVVLGESLWWLQGVAMCGTVVGAVLITHPAFIFGGGTMTKGVAFGYLLALLAATAQACQYVLARKIQRASPTWLSASAMIQISVFMVVMGFADAQGRDVSEALASAPFRSIEWLVAVAVSLLLTTMFTSAGSQLCPVALSATLNLCTRIVCGYVAELLFFGSSLDLLSGTGAAVMVASAVLMSAAKARTSAPKENTLEMHAETLQELEERGERDEDAFDSVVTEIFQSQGSDMSKRRSMVMSKRTSQRSSASVFGSKKPHHVAVVGAGNIGAAIAHHIVCNNVCAKVTLANRDVKRAEAEVMDLQDMDSMVEISAASLQESGRADIIVITAGRGLQGGETRLDVLKANAEVVKTLVEGMKPIRKSSKIIMVSNPCDVLTYLVQEISGLPKSHVLGSGTILDTQRLRVAIGSKLNVNASSVSLYVLGEHGDSQFPAYSAAHIGGVPLKKYPGIERISLEEEARESSKKAARIRMGKGHTAYGVASAVVDIIESVLSNHRRVMTVSVRVPAKQCVLSIPAVVGANGVETVLDVSATLDATEMSMFNTSCKLMEEQVQSLSCMLPHTERATGNSVEHLV